MKGREEMKAEKYIIGRLIRAEEEIERNELVIMELKKRLNECEYKISQIKDCLYLLESGVTVKYGSDDKLAELVGLMYDDGK